MKLLPVCSIEFGRALYKVYIQCFALFWPWFFYEGLQVLCLFALPLLIPIFWSCAHRLKNLIDEVAHRM
jgi:hypothetical protein